MHENLTEQEEMVLNVIQEYLNKNRLFNMKKVIPFIQSRFKLASVNININGIEAILNSLVKKNLLVDGSKLTRDDILKIHKRRDIYNYIREYPGIFFNKIVKDLKFSKHIVIWHLDMLEDFNFIKRAQFENHEIYYTPKLKLEQIKTNFFYHKEKSRNIIKYLNANDTGIAKTRLSNDLKMHPNTVAKYLKILEEYKIITKENHSNSILFFLNEDNLNNLELLES